MKNHEISMKLHERLCSYILRNDKGDVLEDNERKDCGIKALEVNESAPRTTSKGCEKAEESIKKGEHFYTKESFSKIMSI